MHVTRDVVLCMKIGGVPPGVPRVTSLQRFLGDRVHGMENTARNHFTRLLRVRALCRSANVPTRRIPTRLSGVTAALLAHTRHPTAASGFGLSRD
jgi:hypothetical protein